MKFITMTMASLLFIATANAQTAVEVLKKGNTVLSITENTRMWFGFKEGLACGDFNEAGHCVSPRLMFVAHKPVELSQGHSIVSYNEGNAYCLVNVDYTGDQYEKDIRQVAHADATVKFKYVFPLVQNSDETFIEQARKLQPEIVSMPIKDEFRQPKVLAQSVTQFSEPFTVCDGEYSSYRCDTYDTGLAVTFAAALTPTVKIAVKCKAQSAAQLPNGVFSLDVINRILKGDYVLQTVN